MTKPGTSRSQEHRTVSRITGILEYVAVADGSVRLADIVAKLDAPRSSVHGLVHGLVSDGYLVSNEHGHYELGPALDALVRKRSSFDQAVYAVMETLNLEFDETVSLVINTGDSIVTSEAIESSHAIRYTPVLGRRRPLYPTSAGKCFLAHTNSEYRELYLTHHFGSKAERQRVRSELRRVAADGQAINLRETLPDLCAVSTPVFNGPRVAAVITVAGPVSRTTAKLERIAQVARQVTARAGDVSFPH